MTKREAAIVSAYTGSLCGDFGTMHEYIEEIMGRPVFTHELGNREMAKDIRDQSRQDFCAIVID